MFYVVYHEREVIDGPYERKHAEHIVEDLYMLFNDSHYQVFDEEDLSLIGLRRSPKYLIHEDQPSIPG